MSNNTKLEISGWCVFHKSGLLWECVDNRDSEKNMQIYKTKIYKKELNFQIHDNNKIYKFYPDNNEYFYFNEIMNKICKCITESHSDSYSHQVFHGFSYDDNTNNISLISSS